MQESRESRHAKEGNESGKAKKEEVPGTSVASDSKQGTADGKVVQDASKPLNKRKREHEQLLQLAEKIKAKPVRVLLSDRKKK